MRNRLYWKVSTERGIMKYETENVKYCNLCGSSEFTILWDKVKRKKDGLLRSIVITNDTGEIIQGTNVICKHCGLVFISPRLTKEDLDKFYTEDYRKIYKGALNAEVEKHHAETAMKVLKESCEVDVGNRLLDIGCSTGELVDRIRHTRIDSYGIEPNKEHYEIAKSKGLEVECTTIESYDPGMKFDIITMLNALEHVYSPTETLEKIHSLLNEDGYLLICVPNLYNRTIHIPVDAFLSNAHLYNFSIDTLTAYFLKTGFKIVNQYQVTEEMGDKIYLLGQKTDKKWEFIPKIETEVVKNTVDHLKLADSIWHMKYNITQMGFR